MASIVVRTRSSLGTPSVERERIARDLHDGVIQSLIATEMQLDLLRRESQLAGAALDVAETLANVQDLIRLEVRKLRGQIEQLRSSTPPRRVLLRLSKMVEEFQRETGIAAAFACDVHEGSIPLHLSHEILRIVEEALSNVRRHSGARKVEARLSFHTLSLDQLSFHRETLQLVIQDDGRGFDFTGRLPLAQLEATQKGPRVIRERVKSMNGEFVLESDPDRGARLEIRFAANPRVNARHQPSNLQSNEWSMECALPSSISPARNLP